MAEFDDCRVVSNWPDRSSESDDNRVGDESDWLADSAGPDVDDDARQQYLRQDSATASGGSDGGSRRPSRGAVPKSMRTFESYKQLYLALIESALRDYCIGLGADATGLDKRRFRIAEAWVTGDPYDYPLPFEALLDALALDVDAIRAAFAKLKTDPGLHLDHLDQVSSSST